mgnify:CR=1 FL=1
MNIKEQGLSFALGGFMGLFIAAANYEDSNYFLIPALILLAIETYRCISDIIKESKNE